MEDNKTKYIKPFISSLLVGLFFASFSQSCGVTQAGISKLIAPPKLSAIDSSPFTRHQVETKLKFSNISRHDTTFVTKAVPDKVKPNMDSLVNIYGNMILTNQRLGLSNDEVMISYLQDLKEDNEKLRGVIPDLLKKAEISKEVKDDAVSMQAIWKLGQWIFGVVAAILTILIINTLYTMYSCNKRRKRLQA